MRRLLILVVFILSTLTVFAGDVSLAWDHSESTDVVGYRMYYGNSSGAYDTVTSLPYQNTYTVRGLIDGTWFFAVTALNTTAESAYSNEVSQVILNILPVISSISVSSILTTEAIVIWTTSSECSGIALYGLIPSQLFAISSNNLGTTDHLSKLTGLKPRTHYVYKVQSTCGGQTVESDLRSFNTK
jgi:hypothetical protein